MCADRTARDARTTRTRVGSGAPERRSVVCCPDKFRGTLSAREAAEALAAGVIRAGRPAIALPLADGGEGTLEVLAPDPDDRRVARVTGPLGDPVDAEWALRDGRAVIEMARASGLALVEGANDPVRATTRGTGELICAALDAGARHVIVAVGGSATVDGGLGALEALDFDLRDVRVEVACDVTTRFLDAPRVFGPQKGAGRREVEVLERRFAALARRFRDELGVDVPSLPGSGAAGGLAGGLAALGAELVPGAALVADAVGLRDSLRASSLAITGEGRLDATSLAGKVVGHVLTEAARGGIAVAIVAGSVDLDERPAATVALVDVAGSAEAARREAARLVAEAAASLAATM